MKRLTIKYTSLVQGQDPTHNWTSGEKGDVEHSAATQHIKLPNPMQTGVVESPDLFSTGKNVS